MSQHDYVIVGSGSAGSAIARRLADAGADVLLLEAGGPDENPAIHEPGRWAELWMTAEDWGYQTVPQKDCGARCHYWPRGKVLGGSSGLNAMIYVRGNPLDYDAWAYLGNHGWSYADVLPYFKKSEDFDAGESQYHGAGGPLRVTSRYEPHPLAAAFVQAAQEAGVPFNPDFNAATQHGVGYAQLTVKAGRRQSTAEAFLRPVLERSNLSVSMRSHALRLLFDGNRCKGVEFERAGAVLQAEARSEVIVSAGSIESPKLLMLSGIGDARALQLLNIPVIEHLPGVGQNLQDHLLAPVICSARRPVPATVPGLQQLHAQLFASSREGLAVPDTQPLFFHIPLAAYYEGMTNPEHGFTLMPGLVRPASRGSITLVSSDPSVRPAIDPGYLSRQADVDAMVFSLEQCRAILAQPALKEWLDAELYPGPQVSTRKAIAEFLRATAGTYHHQAGTCKMGTDSLAVVDPELRVHGISGLRVADASVMPTVPTGNTNAPTIMIGEKAADLLLASAKIV